MAASDYVPISFKNRLHLAGRPQMGSCARFARIYSGLLPALVLILAVDRLTLALTGESSIAAT
jgi:hypothetical protein